MLAISLARTQRLWNGRRARLDFTKSTHFRHFRFSGSSASSKGIGWGVIRSVLLGQLLQRKTRHLSGIFLLLDCQKPSRAKQR